jgi:hypothetical protein
VLAELDEHAIWKVGCADAVPITQKPVLKRSGEPYAATNGTYWFGEGGTGDPEKGDRPLLYLEELIPGLGAKVAQSWKPCS